MCPHGAIELRIPEYAAEQKRREVEREVKRRKIPVIVEPSGSDPIDEVAFTYQAAPAGTSTQALNEAKEAALAAIDEEARAQYIAWPSARARCVALHPVRFVLHELPRRKHWRLG